MGFGLLNAFFVFLANYIYFHKLFDTYSLIHSLHIATVLWIFPSIYLYIKSIVESERQLRKEYWHFLPGLIFGLTSAILFGLLLNHDEKIYYLSNYRSGVQFASQNIKMVSVFSFCRCFANCRASHLLFSKIHTDYRINIRVN